MARHGFNVRALSVCLAALLLLCPAAAPAQGGGAATLKVTVVDPNGAAVPGARVSVRTGAGTEVSARADERGEATLARLQPGAARVTAEAEGFEASAPEELTLAPGANRAEVRLEVAALKEELEVAPDEQGRNLDPRGPAFSNVLTAADLAQLPDDPEEFEAALNQLAGPGANFRVNGFRGGRLPPKSQIREIRFRRNPFAAENHERGFVSVDISTKPGAGEWHGAVGLGFRDESLNARQPFASFRGPEQFRRFDFSLDGPVWKNRTSLFLAADANSTYDSKTVVAALPSGRFDDLILRPSRKLNLSARAEHALDKVHSLRAEYQRNATRQDNLGVGDFDLPERAYTLDQAEHVFRLSESGVFAKRFLNELRFQARWQERETRAAFSGPALFVNGAFNGGGALTRGTRRALEFELADNVDFSTENHSMRAGFELEAARYRSDETTNPAGVFTFAGLEEFAAGRPTTFSRRAGDPRLSFSQYQFGWYWQDDWRASKSLMLSYGVRHEMQTNLPDRGNFAPRVGLAWTPTKSGSVTLRAGAGLFYDWFESGTYEQTLRVDGRRQQDFVVIGPGFPDPLGGGAGVTLPPGRIEADPELKMPSIWVASIGVDTRPSKWFRLGVDYRFERGLHLLRGRNVNAPLAGGGRPRPDFGNVTRVESSASSTTHAVMAHLSPGSFVNGFFWSVMYRYARSLSDTAGPLGLPADNFDLRGEWGPAPNDVRHLFSAMLNRRLRYGFTLGLMFGASTAPPYNITTGFDDNGDTVSNDRPAGVGRNSARGSGRAELSARLGWGFGFGGDRPSSMQGGPVMIRVGGSDAGPPALPGASTKRFRLDLYAQFFNLLNHTNPTGYSGVQTSPFFGQATASLPGRRVETGLRFSF